MDQPELFPDPEHRSAHMHRLRFSASEQIYLDAWRALNERKIYVNEGFTALEWLLTGTGTPRPVTQRDAVVAASFAQWLGTNCGRGFIWDAERKIDRLNETLRRSDWKAMTGDVGPTMREQAMRIAVEFGLGDNARLITRLAAALETVAWERSFHRSDPGAPRAIILREDA